MSKRHLSDYFVGIAAKRLSSVEINKEVSNQREFNGVSQLREILGNNDSTEFPATFIWLGGENEGQSEPVRLSWYDARREQAHRAAEWRLYYSSNDLIDLVKPQDLLVVAKRAGGELVLIFAPQGSTIENQLMILFGLQNDLQNHFKVEKFSRSDDKELDFVSRYILEELGIDINDPDQDDLDGLLDECSFSTQFPTTRAFSEFSRQTSRADPGLVIEDPDQAIMMWMTHEEALFKRLERRMITWQLEKGFNLEGNDNEVDIDGFISFSLSVQNRRKARAGLALEHHLEAIFRKHNLRYQRGARTENNARPDFLFPGSHEYHDLDYPASHLLMLGVKASCKDRWRQVLSEAERIRRKHLFTLEPGISENQTREMIAHDLQLVVPQEIFATYTSVQQENLMNVNNLLTLLKERQSFDQSQAQSDSRKD